MIIMMLYYAKSLFDETLNARLIWLTQAPLSCLPKNVNKYDIQAIKISEPMLQIVGGMF